MQWESDSDYFARRSDEETKRAFSAPHGAARIAHLELAARYAQLSAAGEPAQPIAADPNALMGKLRRR